MTRSTHRLSTRQKSMVLLPLALASGVWTASLVTASATASGDDGKPGALPDGTKVPTRCDRGSGECAGARCDRSRGPRGLC